MTFTVPTLAWEDVFLSLAVLPVAAFAVLAATFFAREAWKFASGYYDKRRGE